MKKCIIIVSALLCIMTISGCSAPQSVICGDSSMVNITTATARITVQDGCEVGIWEEETDGAIDFRQWIAGFETEPADNIPEDGRLYTIELSFGEPITHTYFDCGKRGCYLNSGDGWLTVKNPSPLPRGGVGVFGIYFWIIDKIEYTNCGGTEELDLSDEEKLTISNWLSGLKYTRRWFPEGEAPGDTDGGEVYTFTFKDSELSYVSNGGNERYLLFGGEWYGITGADFPAIGRV